MLSDKAMEAICNSMVYCQGCGCEPEYEEIEYTKSTPRRVTGYRCACGTVVSQGIYMGNAATLVREQKKS
jgi:hypothetical protein